MTGQFVVNIVLALGLLAVSIGNMILQKQINSLNHFIMMLVKLYDHKRHREERDKNDSADSD